MLTAIVVFSVFSATPTLAAYIPAGTMNPSCAPGSSLECDIAPSSAVSNGGTGLTSFTAGDLLYASAADTLAKLSIGVNGKVLKISGGTLSWEDDNGGTTYTAGTGLILSGGAFNLDINGLSVLASVAQDDYIPIYDTSTGLSTKVSRNDFLAPVLGALNYQGSWDASASATPATCDPGSKGYYYVASVAGNGYFLNDWAICNGATWDKLTSTSAVASVFGRAGVVIASGGDYNASQITNTPSGDIAAITVQNALNELDTEKLSNVLNTGLLFIGNGSNVAAGVAMSGDATIANTGALTLASNSVDGSNIALGSDVAGDIMYYNGTDYVRLGAGTAGQALVINSGATAPEWQTVAISNIYSANGSLTGARNVTLNGNALIFTGSTGALQVASTGDVSATGNISQTGATTLSTGTGDISLNGATALNGNTTLAANKTLALTGSTSGTVALAAPDTITSYTLTLPSTSGTPGQVITTDGTGALSWANGGGAFSSLAAATAINSIDNLNFGQTWNWSTATTQTPMTITTDALTAGSGLALTTSSTNLASTNGLLYVANTGTSISGILARLQSNSTAGSGLTVLTNGNVGIGTATPNADALLDLTSTDKGLLLPRVALTSTTSFAPLSAHVAGMTVYNTATTGDVTPGVYSNNGTAWVKLSGGAVSTSSYTSNIDFNNAGNYTASDAAKIQVSGGLGSLISSSVADGASNASTVNSVPIMTSATTPSGEVTATVGSSTPYLAFDDSNAAGTWAAPTKVAYIQYSFSAGTTKIINKYALSPWSQTNAPADWTFLGSNDGSNWTTLDTRTGQRGTLWAYSSNINYYTFSNSTGYRYYRLSVTDTFDSSSSVVISRFSLIEAAGSVYPTSVSDLYLTTTDTTQISASTATAITGATFTQTVPANTGIKYLVSFDGRTTWKYWSGSNWVTSTLSNINTNGNSSSVMSAALISNWYPALGTKLDFAINLYSTSSSATPSIDNIEIIRTATSPADLAEDYPTKDATLTAGDLVSLDTENKGFVKRALTGERLIGIVSTNPHTTMGKDAYPGEIVVPIALAGRVPTKVSDENGAIKIGDKITLSSVSGVGMKANPWDSSVGYALEDYAGTGQGMISVFVNLDPGFSFGENGGSQNLTIITLNQLAISGALSVDGHITMGVDTVGEATVLSGTTSTTISFATPYTEKPIITISKNTQGGLSDYYIDEVTATGFKIKIDPVQTKDITFSWHAFAKKGEAFTVAPDVE